MIYYKNRWVQYKIFDKSEMAWVPKILRKLTTFVYDMIISRFLTITAHILMLPHISPPAEGSTGLLDVGTGTGAPLLEIANQLKNKYNKIVGVDLHHEYTIQAQKRFQDDKEINIYEMDFYDVAKNLKDKFAMVLFSFSFMLMPDQVKAINVARQVLQNNGKISFIMTINEKENRLMMRLKPLIYKLTSVDFGNQTYQRQFEEVLKIGGLKLEKQVRIKSKSNLLLWIFPVYYVETSIA